MISAAWTALVTIGAILIGAGVVGAIWGLFAWWDERRHE